MDEHTEKVVPFEAARARRSDDSGVADSHFKVEASDVVPNESLDGAANGHADAPVAPGRATPHPAGDHKGPPRVFRQAMGRQ